MVQALAQAGDEPPVRAVVVHLDLLPDDALFLINGLLGKVGLAHHFQQHVQALVQLFRRRKEIAGAVKGRESVGVGTGLGKLGKGVPVLVLKHLVLQEMGHARREMYLFVVQPEVPVNGAKAGGINDMGAGVARHGPHDDRQARGQHFPLVGSGLLQNALFFRHGYSPPLVSDSS